MTVFHGRLVSMPLHLLNEADDLFRARPLVLVVKADCTVFAQATGDPVRSVRQQGMVCSAHR